MNSKEINSIILNQHCGLYSTKTKHVRMSHSYMYLFTKPFNLIAEGFPTHSGYPLLNLFTNHLLLFQYFELKSELN